MSTATRSSVMNPNSTTRPISPTGTSPWTNVTVFHSATRPTAISAPYQSTSPKRCGQRVAVAGAITGDGGRRGFMPARRKRANACPMTPRIRERRIMVSAHELFGVCPTSCSSRNQSALAISGRNSS